MRHKSPENYVSPAAREQRKRSRREPVGITITPLRGFFMTLLFLGVPTVSLGSLCFLLIQNNLHLSEKNDELSQIAVEVKADIDSLGAEIEFLRERAGVAKHLTTRPTQVDQSSNPDSRPLNKPPDKRDDSLMKDPASAILAQPAYSRQRPATPPPKGGLAQIANTLDLLKDAKSKLPKLSTALDSAIKPALEETLAEEAAYPDGQPVAGVAHISSRFGIRGNPFGGGGYEVHEGMDFVGEHGDLIVAAGNGVVTKAGRNGGYGISVTIDHGYGYETLYAHMSKKRVAPGDRIKRGQIIGHIGSTGRSSGPHLHYGIYKDNVAIDPAKVMVLPENPLAIGPR